MSRRTEAATRLQEALAEEVRGMDLPAALEAHPDTWDVVAPAAADFLNALALWERTGTDAAGDRMICAYRAVLAAWKRAASTFEVA